MSLEYSGRKPHSSGATTKTDRNEANMQRKTEMRELMAQERDEKTFMQDSKNCCSSSYQYSILLI